MKVGPERSPSFAHPLDGHAEKPFDAYVVNGDVDAAHAERDEATAVAKRSEAKLAKLRADLSEAEAALFPQGLRASNIWYLSLIHI